MTAVHWTQEDFLTWLRDKNFGLPSTEWEEANERINAMSKSEREHLIWRLLNAQLILWNKASEEDV